MLRNISKPSVTIAILFALGSLAGCGDKDKDKDKAEDTAEDTAKPETKAEPEAEKPKSSGFSLSGSRSKLSGWGRSAGKRVSESADSARDQANTAANAAADAIKRGAGAIQGGAVGVAARAQERAVASKERIVALTGDQLKGPLVVATVARFGQQLDRLADDPTRERTNREKAIKFAIRQIPVLKQMDKYADARALYAHYADGDDAHSAEMRQDAKRQVLLLSINVGLDVTMFGLPSALDVPFEFVDTIIDNAELAAKASELLGEVPWVSLTWSDLSAKDLDVLSPVLDRALQDPVVDSSATTLLTVQFTE